MEKRMKVVVWTLVLFLVAIGVAIGAYINFSAVEDPTTPPVTPPSTDAPQSCFAPFDLVVAIPTKITPILGLIGTTNTPEQELTNIKAAAVALINKMQANGGIFVASDQTTASSLFRVSVISYGENSYWAEPTVNNATVIAEMGTRTASQIIDAINALTLTPIIPLYVDADLADGIKLATAEFNGHARRQVGGSDSGRIGLFLAPNGVHPLTTEPAGGRPSAATLQAFHALTDESHVLSSIQDSGAISGPDDLFKLVAEPESNYKQVAFAGMTAAAENFFDTEICAGETGARSGADLSLQVTADKSAINTNDEFTYTMTLLNSGPEAAADVVVAGGVPAGTVITAPTFTTSHFVRDGTWEVGAVASGETKTLSYKVKVTAATGTVVDAVVEISASSVADPDSTPNNGVVTEDDYSKLSMTVGATTGGTTPPTTGTGGTTPPATTGGSGSTGTGGTGTGTSTPTAPATGFGTSGVATIAIGLALLAAYSGLISYRRRATAK